MATEQREFKPLIESIEKVLAELQGETLSPSSETAVYELRNLYNDYVTCCCRRAHVIKDPDPPA
jgi:hypothetical protein